MTASKPDFELPKGGGSPPKEVRCNPAAKCRGLICGVKPIDLQTHYKNQEPLVERRKYRLK